MKPSRTTAFIALAITGAALWSILPRSTEAAALLPFQGRLTDADGNSIPDGAKVVQFQLFDAPTGGTVKWAGEVQKLTVNGGLVNTILGTKADLTGVDFSQTIYMQITVDANNDGQITAADPPLLPRQTVFPALFSYNAVNAAKLSGYGWNAVFDNSDPATGKIHGSKLAPGTLPGSALSDVPASKITGLINGSQIEDESIHTADIADGAITSAKLGFSSEHAVFYEEVGQDLPAVSGWQPRGINVGANSAGGAISRSGATVTLRPGTYFVEAESVAFAVGTHQLILRDVTTGSQGSPQDASTPLKGLSAFTHDNAGSTSTLRGYITIASNPRQFELWHFAGGPFSLGLGVTHQAGNPFPNRFSQIHILKIQ